jgi:hypothetical protein
MLDALGAAGIVGLGVLCFCFAFYVGTLAPAQRELETRIAAAASARALPGTLPVAADRDAMRLERFHESFPSADRLTDEIAALYAHAKAANLKLQQAEYRLVPTGGGLAAYRVVLPIRGSYAQLRRFVGRVLEDMPTASVDGMSFQRRNASEGALEARLRLTIHLRPAAPERRI